MESILTAFRFGLLNVSHHFLLSVILLLSFALMALVFSAVAFLSSTNHLCGFAHSWCHGNAKTFQETTHEQFVAGNLNANRQVNTARQQPTSTEHLVLWSQPAKFVVWRLNDLHVMAMSNLFQSAVSEVMNGWIVPFSAECT